MRVYLAGPINGCSDEEAHGWRTEAMRLRPEIEWLDPMHRDYRGREDQHVSDIVEGDKADIDQCEALLAYAAAGPSWGTAMEIIYAWKRAKWIVVVVDLHTPVSPWLRYHADAIFTSVESAVAAL